MKRERYRLPVYSLKLVKERTVSYPVPDVSNVAAAFVILREMIGDKAHEHMVAIFLNGRNEPVGTHVVAIGGHATLSTNVGSVVRAALVHNASAIVLGHNHPSGDPTPSVEDVAFTNNAIMAANIVGCPIVDHVIVAGDRFTSFLERGLMPRRESKS